MMPWLISCQLESTARLKKMLSSVARISRPTAVREMLLLLARRHQPNQTSRLLVGAVLDLADFGQHLSQLRAHERADAHDPVRQLACGNLVRNRPHTGLQNLRHVDQGQEIPRGRQEPLAIGGRMGHAADVEVGHIAHIDDAEVELRTPGHGRHRACAG